MSSIIDDILANDNINTSLHEPPHKIEHSNESPSHSVDSKSSSNSLKAFIGLLSFNNFNEGLNDVHKSKHIKNNTKRKSNIPSNIKAKIDKLVIETNTETKATFYKPKGTLFNKVQKMRNNIEKNKYHTINNVFPHLVNNYSSVNNGFPQTKKMLIGLKSKKMEEQHDMEDFKYQFSDQIRNPFGLKEFEKKFRKRSSQRNGKPTIFVNSNNNSKYGKYSLYNNNWLIQNMLYLNTQ